MNTSLALALERNTQRPTDQQVPVESIKSVLELLEAPSIEEGFIEVLEVAP